MSLGDIGFRCASNVLGALGDTRVLGAIYIGDVGDVGVDLR